MVKRSILLISALYTLYEAVVWSGLAVLSSCVNGPDGTDEIWVGLIFGFAFSVNLLSLLHDIHFGPRLEDVLFRMGSGFLSRALWFAVAVSLLLLVLLYGWFFYVIWGQGVHRSDFFLWGALLACIPPLLGCWNISSQVFNPKRFFSFALQVRVAFILLFPILILLGVGNFLMGAGFWKDYLCDFPRDYIREPSCFYGSCNPSM